MEGNSKKLITFLLGHEGKDFDAILKDEIEGTAGFSFTSYIHKAKIHIQAGRITVSEPKTGKYFSLPLCGIKQICGETCGQYDIALTIKYNNDYGIFIQIFES
ncbi:hypothetical protein PH210_04605 [Paenibacillus sp. BSR1-1]|uniref:hypothetical protein n=1 Tax=Paenibacillus sp. BSR1-1 TaxID=3020845 RepID=UPI0025B08759|nr:hypothetical protein [Paenibacillus sp. BSR1-1]MDN3015489.1 hypothetical protein [Paenibacillus sp. BSR1-1]